jgi:hypothetical protein
MAREPEELVEMRRVLDAQLAAFRLAAGLTQGQLAKAAFCDRSTVAHIEKGRSRGMSGSGRLPTSAAKPVVRCLPGFMPGERPNRTMRYGSGKCN